MNDIEARTTEKTERTELSKRLRLQRYLFEEISSVLEVKRLQRESDERMLMYENKFYQ